MSGTGCARIPGCGQSCALLLLMSWRIIEGQLYTCAASILSSAFLVKR